MGTKLAKIELTGLKDFNNVIEYYKQTMDMVKDKMSPYHITVPIYDDLNPTCCYERVIINNSALVIAQDFDIIEKNKPDNIDEIIFQELEKNEESKKGSSGPMKKIMNENKLSSFETLKQVRNSLLHGSYSINVYGQPRIVNWGKTNKDDDNNNNIISYKKDLTLTPLLASVHLTSKYMSADMNEEYICLYLKNLYSTVRNKYSDCAQMISVFTNKEDISCKNFIYQSRFLDSLKTYTIKGTQNEDNNIDATITNFPVLKNVINFKSEKLGYNHFEIEESDTKEQKQFFRYYINYLGRDNWSKIVDLPTDMQQSILSDLCENSAPGIRTNINDFNDFFGLISGIQILKTHKEEPSDQMIRDLLKYTFESPIIYANTLLELAGYTCIYVKEQNNKNEIPLFEYHNIEGINGIEPILDNGPIKSIRKDMPGEEKKEAYNKYISGLENQRKNIEKKIEKCKKFKDSLNDKNPKRKEEEKESNLKIKEYMGKYEKIEKKIEQMEIRRKEYDDNYTDSSEFFRHIRNSIAHGNYEINYDKALDHKDLTEIEYDFYDYPEGEIENPEFYVKLKASRLLQIANGVQKRVNKQLENEKNFDKIKKSLTYLDRNENSDRGEDDGER